MATYVIYCQEKFEQKLFSCAIRIPIHIFQNSHLDQNIHMALRDIGDQKRKLESNQHHFIMIICVGG